MSEQRIAILLDGTRVHAMAASAGLKLDYEKLLAWSGEQGKVVAAKFFTQTPPEGEHPVFRLIDYLEFHGWDVIERTANMVRKHDDSGERMIGNMDTYIVAEACKLAYSGKVDKVFLLAGSSELSPAVEALKSQLVETVIIGVRDEGEKSWVANHLLRAAAGNMLDFRDLPFAMENVPRAA